MNDPYNTGTPKYSTAQDIYDALEVLVQSEEMGILGEMFTDVSWDGQDYYYTENGYKLKKRFDEMSDFGNKMWLMDLAVWQLEESEVHDLVYEALYNEDLAKRIGFKKMFIDEVLRGVKQDYDAVTEDWYSALGELSRFDFYSMRDSLQTVLKEHGHYPINFPYNTLCNKFYDKLKGLKLQEETRLIAECRALLTSYDDFMFGLRSNQHLYGQLEQQYQSKVACLQASYEEKVKQLLLMAESQGVVLSLPETALSLPAADFTIEGEDVT